MGHCNGLKETYERLSLVTLLFQWEKFDISIWNNLSIKGDVYDDAYIGWSPCDKNQAQYMKNQSLGIFW